MSVEPEVADALWLDAEEVEEPEVAEALWLDAGEVEEPVAEEDHPVDAESVQEADAVEEGESDQLVTEPVAEAVLVLVIEAEVLLLL